MASGGYSTLDYGSDVTYENSVVGTPSKGSEGGLEMETEALAVEDQAAILAASRDRKENQQQESNTTTELTRNGSEEVGAEMQNQAEFMDVVATHEVCLFAECVDSTETSSSRYVHSATNTVSFVLKSILSRRFDQNYSHFKRVG